MFIAHLPAGYLLSRVHPVLGQYPFWVVLGSVLPDLDMLYFYAVDHGMVHHHSYLTHRPAVWICLSLMFRAVGNMPMCAIAAGAMLHMALDTVTGAIAWGWPIWDDATPLIVVPSTQDWWVMSFVLHWTFALEGMICLAAALCFLHHRIRGGAKT